MKYINADMILPDSLVKELQKYVQPGYIYIPAIEHQHRSWGELSGGLLPNTKYFLFLFNEQRRRIIPVTAVRQKSNDCLPLVLRPLCQPERRIQGSP